MSTPVNRSQTPLSQRHPASSSQIDGGAGGSNTGNSRSVNPFTLNPHGHPAVNPAKSGTKSSADSKGPKQPKAPDKPLMPYMRYSRKVWDSVKASNPDLKLWEIGKIIGQMWRELLDEEKQVYLDEYDAEKIVYVETLKTYHSSPAYQSWLLNKGKTDTDAAEVEEQPEKARRTKNAGGSVEVRTVSILHVDDDDDTEAGYSINHIAAARYRRNNALINDIFNDVVIPDVRSIVSETRMTALKRQVQSLTVHQKKLESELEQLEQKHVTKKCKFSESSDRFYDDLTKLFTGQQGVMDEQFKQTRTKAKEELMDKQLTMQREQAVPEPKDTGNVNHVKSSGREVVLSSHMASASQSGDCSPTNLVSSHTTQRIQQENSMANQALSAATVYTEANESDDALHLQSTANIQIRMKTEPNGERSQQEPAVNYPTTTCTAVEQAAERTEMDEIMELFNAASRKDPTDPMDCATENVSSFGNTGFTPDDNMEHSGSGVLAEMWNQSSTTENVKYPSNTIDSGLTMKSDEMSLQYDAIAS